MVEEALSFLRINAFYVSFDVSNVYVSSVFYAVNAFYAVSAFADHQNCDSHFYRFEQVVECYRIKEFDPLPM